METGRRLRRIEIELRIWRLSAVAAALVVALGAASGAGPAAFKLKSEDGKSEVSLQADRLVFRREGKPVAALVAGERAPALVLGKPAESAATLTSEGLSFKTNEKPRLGLLAVGEKQNRGLMLYDDKANARAGLLLSIDAEPSLLLYGKDDGLTRNVSLQASITDTDEPRLSLMAGKGKPAVVARISSEWSGFRAIHPKATQAALTVTPAGVAEVSLEDEDGRSLRLTPKQ